VLNLESAKGGETVCFQIGQRKREKKQKNLKKRGRIMDFARNKGHPGNWFCDDVQSFSHTVESANKRAINAERLLAKEDTEC